MATIDMGRKKGGTVVPLSWGELGPRLTQCGQGEVYFHTFLTRVSQCTCSVVGWMQSNRLQLNCGKTDFTWLTTNLSLHRLPTMCPTIGSVTVVPSQSLCDLGVYIDPDLTMRTQVQRIASRGFAVLRHLRSMCHYVPTSVFRSLVTAFVLNRLDYCNSLLVDLPANLLQRL